MALSEIVREVKLALIDMEDSLKRPEIHLTNTVTNEIIQLSMMPKEIKARTTTSFRTFNIIERGEVKLPKGEELASFSWTGILPGARLLLYSDLLDVTVWEQPKEIIAALTRWRENGEKIKLLITQTSINHDVYLKSFDTEYSGMLGNVEYTVNFIAAKELKILTVEEADKARAKAQEQQANELNRRAAMKSRTGILIGKINNAWTLAQILTGNGGNWEELMDRNGIEDPTKLDPTEWVIWM